MGTLLKLRTEMAGFGPRGDKRGVVLVVLAALAASSTRVVRNVSCGHDFEFHLISWMEALRSWRQGVVYPHWAQSPNWAAGEPRFVFYPPLTWMLGGALGSFVSWNWVPAAMTFMFLAAAGLTTRALARSFLPRGNATLAGILATATPYGLFCAYERTAFAELAATAFIPLLLLYALKTPKVGQVVPLRGLAAESGRRPMLLPEAKPVIAVAVLLALVWLTNAPAGVMASYLLAFAALAAGILERSWVPVLRALAAAPLGLGLAAFYLTPAAWEQRWIAIHQALDVGMRVRDSWLFARHGGASMELHDQVLRVASTIFVLTATLAAAGLAVALRRRQLTRATRGMWLPIALLIPGLLLLQFSISEPLWHLPKLEFLQFPWRWLMVLGTPLAIFLGAATPLGTRRWRIVAALGWGMALLLCIGSATVMFYQYCDEEDKVDNQLALFKADAGVDGTDEYAPLNTDNTLVASGLPDGCLVGDPEQELGESDKDPEPQVEPVWFPEQGSCDDTFTADLWQSEHKVLSIEADQFGYLILRLRRYPAWRITVQGKPVELAAQREDGLVVIPVPAGESTVEVQWTTTPDVWWGRGISLASLLVLAGLWVVGRFVRGRGGLISA